RARVGRASVRAGGRSVRLELGLRGEACGDVAVRGSPAWSDDGTTLRLLAIAPEPGEGERLSAAGLEPASLVRGLAANVRIRPPLDPAALKDVLPGLAASLSEPRVEVRAVVSRVTPTRAAARGDDLVAWTRLRG